MMTKAMAERLLPKVRARMGRNGALLEQVVALCERDGRANLGAVLDALYPGVEKEAAQAKLRQLRLEIAKAAKKQPEMQFALEGDGKTRSDVSDRWVWFDGIAGFNAAETKRLDPVFIEMDAMRRGPSRCVVLYAAADKADARAMLKVLAPHCRAEEIELWTGEEILPGEDRAEEWERACRRTDLALLLDSPEFRADAEAQRVKARLEELRVRLVPIELHAMSDESEHAFDRQTKAPQKREFARRVAGQMRGRLERQVEVWKDQLELAFQEGDAAVTSFERAAGDTVREMQRANVIDLLREWLFVEKQPPYCALLGELGIGKTTTVRELARQLNDGGDKVALYFDLRYVRDLARKEPDLDAILEQMLRLGWKGTSERVPPSVCEVLDAVAQGALIIFDGLDEVLVNLTEAQGQMFTRQLFRARPVDGNGKGKLLITCRTHYFRTIQHESGHFTTEDRDAVRAETYRALVLLPFREEQIRGYLNESLGSEEEGARALQLIGAVHNLRELAERPYMLSLIRRQFGKLEAWKAEGRRVTGVTLYRFFVEEWLLRDTGKHQLIPEHKEMAMEEMAWMLAVQGQRSWTALEMEDWLLDFLAGNPRVARRYEGVARELLFEDLRTATFLVREGADQFRFAHSSLQEYFLAGCLRRALESANPAARWEIGGSGVSRETLDFLGQSLGERPSVTAQEGLGKLRDRYVERASELALAFWAMAAKKGYPAPAARGFQLAGTSLWEFEAEGLDLAGANLRGAELGNSAWKRCVLAGADLTGVKAERSEWDRCDLTGARVEGAEWDGAMFRKCLGMRNEMLPIGSKVVPGQSHFHQRRVTASVGHGGLVNDCAISPDGRLLLSASDDGVAKVWDAKFGRTVCTFWGHAGPVTSCAFSPDAKLALTGGSDGTLRLWSVDSQHGPLAIAAHKGTISDCAFSPDGRLLLSASYDAELKLWDTATGHHRVTLCGHRESVKACGFSSDGRLIVSASEGRGMKVWEVSSGRCLHNYPHYDLRITACAISPDAMYLASGSAKGVVRLWELESERLVWEYAAHLGAVVQCKFAAAGSLIASGSDEGTIRLFGVESAQCTATFLSGTNSGAFDITPDGLSLLSTSDRRMLKLWDVAAPGHASKIGSEATWDVGCCVSGDGHRLLRNVGEGALALTDRSSGKRHATCVVDSRHRLLAWAFCHDDRHFITALSDGSRQLWSSDSGRCIQHFQGFGGVVTQCGFSGDGRRVLWTAGDGILKYADSVSGETIQELSGFVGPAKALISAAGDAVALFVNASLRLWVTTSTQAKVVVLEAGTKSLLGALALSRDGRHLLHATYDGPLNLWDCVEGKVAATFHDCGSIIACAISDDGRRIVSASREGRLVLLDSTTGKSIAESPVLVPHSGSLRFLPTGQTILVVGGDCIYEVDARTLEEVGYRYYHLHPPHCEDPTWATLDMVNNRVVAAGPGAWRALGWVVPDEKDGLPRWEPAEAFGEMLPD